MASAGQPFNNPYVAPGYNGSATPTIQQAPRFITAAELAKMMKYGAIIAILILLLWAIVWYISHRKSQEKAQEVERGARRGPLGDEQKIEQYSLFMVPKHTDYKEAVGYFFFGLAMIVNFYLSFAIMRNPFLVNELIPLPKIVAYYMLLAVFMLIGAFLLLSGDTRRLLVTWAGTIDAGNYKADARGYWIRPSFGFGVKLNGAIYIPKEMIIGTSLNIGANVAPIVFRRLTLEETEISEARDRILSTLKGDQSSWALFMADLDLNPIVAVHPAANMDPRNWTAKDKEQIQQIVLADLLGRKNAELTFKFNAFRTDIDKHKFDILKRIADPLREEDREKTVDEVVRLLEAAEQAGYGKILGEAFAVIRKAEGKQKEDQDEETIEEAMSG